MHNKMITEIYARSPDCTHRISSKGRVGKFDAHIKEGDGERIADVLSQVKGVDNVEIMMGSLDVVDFPIGWRVKGTTYHPEEVMGEVCRQNYSIVDSKINPRA